MGELVGTKMSNTLAKMLGGGEKSLQLYYTCKTWNAEWNKLWNRMKYAMSTQTGQIGLSFTLLSVATQRKVHNFYIILVTTTLIMNILPNMSMFTHCICSQHAEDQVSQCTLKIN